MPRRRTIACDHCGYLQLKRDTHCDQCGRMTRRERTNVYWIALSISIVLTVVAFVIWRARTFSIM